jgi:hypothetical protein
MLIVRTQPVRVLGTGTWSTGNEAPDKQVRYGDADGGRLAAFITIFEPGGDSRKIGLAAHVPPDAAGPELGWVELDLAVQDRRGGGAKFRVESITQVAEPKASKPVPA